MPWEPSVKSASNARYRPLKDCSPICTPATVWPSNVSPALCGVIPKCEVEKLIEVTLMPQHGGSVDPFQVREEFERAWGVWHHAAPRSRSRRNRSRIDNGPLVGF